MLVTVAGEVDVLTAPRLRAALDSAPQDAGGDPVVADLTRVTLLASAGLSALVEATEEAAQLREPLRLVVDHQRPVLRPLQLTGLDHMLALHHNLADALAVRG